MWLMCDDTAGSSKATASDSLSAIRSSSTLPITEPNGEPPTPTRMAGAANTFQFEDRGDLIKFYNSVRVFHSLHVHIVTCHRCALLAVYCLLLNSVYIETAWSSGRVGFSSVLCHFSTFTNSINLNKLGVI